MILARSWCSSENAGVCVPGGACSRVAAPDLNSGDAAIALIGAPVKYFSRMTADTRLSLHAAALAAKAAGWLPAKSEIGLLAAGYEGCIQADERYFADYVASGRSMGRGNLFIYTLPTSAPGEVAIALGLTGPTMHIHADGGTFGSLIETAEQMIGDGEAAGMICLWSDPTAAVCAAVGAGPTDDRFDIAAITPLELARQWAK